jgi:hypothetical protein
MDIQLPVLEGYDAMRQTKALPGLAAIPIIAANSLAMKRGEEQARASKAAQLSPPVAILGPRSSARCGSRPAISRVGVALEAKRLDPNSANTGGPNGLPGVPQTAPDRSPKRRIRQGATRTCGVEGR